jgi:hypothetical protein
LVWKPTASDGGFACFLLHKELPSCTFWMNLFEWPR